MAITGHVTTRVYGEVFGSTPFQNGDGQSAFSNVKPYPTAPFVSVGLENANIWGLPNGILVGNTYVYSVIELPASGSNHASIKLATNDSLTTLTTNAT